MKKTSTLLVLLLALLFGSSAHAYWVWTNWWSNQTDSENVYAPWDTERVRLDSFFEGYIEGEVLLPEWGAWRIYFPAHTDESFSHPEEYFAIYIDGVLIDRLFNTPTNTSLGAEHLLVGDRFSYRFEFSSPSNINHHHMVVDPGWADLMPFVPVVIELREGGTAARIKPGSKGVIPVAILTTTVADGDPLDFDAWEVIASSLAFGPDGAGIAHSDAHAEDADGDGDLDMVVHFRARETGISCGDTEVVLTGATLGGQAIEAIAAIETVGCEPQAAAVLRGGSAPSDPTADRAERRAQRREAGKKARRMRRLERQ